MIIDKIRRVVNAKQKETTEVSIWSLITVTDVWRVVCRWT